MKQELSINDKISILGLQKIENEIIHSKEEKTVVFEYFSLFSEKFIFNLVNELDIDFQVKIKKQDFEKIKDQILNSKYIDIEWSLLEEKKPFYISLDKKNKNIIEDLKKEDDFKLYINEEKGKKYIYRHYIIIKAPEIDSLNEFIHSFISKIKNKKIILRLLKEKDIKDYLFEEINFPFFQENYIHKREYNIQKQAMYSFLDYLNIKTLCYIIVIKFKRFLDIIAKSFISNKIWNIEEFFMNLLSAKTYKGENFIQIGENYKWGIQIKGIPTEEFNILYSISSELTSWDSILINLYNEKKHKEDKEKKGIEKFMKEKNIDRTKYNYLQMIINFNDINESILTKRINDYQLKIWTDFYSQRIVWVMWSYLNTILGIGNNKLKYEKRYKNENITNLIF